MVLLTIGNTFRNRNRVLIIEIALIVSGTIFMMVMGVSDATNYTFGSKLAETHNYQVNLAFPGLERAQEVERIAQSTDDVTAVESWLVLGASARPAAQAEGEVTDARISIFGQPQDTTLYQADIQDGRWLTTEDAEVAVVSASIMERQGWQIGELITLADSQGRELDVQIVGSLFDPAINTSIHVPIETLQRQWGYIGQVNTVFAQTARTDAESQLAVAEALETAYEAQAIDVSPRATFGETTIAAITEFAGEGYTIIINLLAVMAVVIALVGGVGLSGIISLSVLERRQEVGVMRAIGASSWQVVRLFVGEGILLGFISWLIALPVSIVVAYFFVTQGLSLALNQQLVYQFTPQGAVIWLVIITILAIIASTLPARGAARISVRESLSYQ
jgi:putative ABC transport system permease protein